MGIGRTAADGDHRLRTTAREERQRGVTPRGLGCRGHALSPGARERPSRIEVKITLQRAMGGRLRPHHAGPAALRLGPAARRHRGVPSGRRARPVEHAVGRQSHRELERKVRERIEASRPPSQLDRLREQVRQPSTIPTLDPRIKLGALKFTNAAIATSSPTSAPSAIRRSA